MKAEQHKLKTIFAGTPQVASDILAYLLDAQQRITHVYTQPDRPAGRGRVLTASPVKTLAMAQAMPVLQPQSLKSDDQVHLLQQFAPDVLVVVAYGLLLPEAILAVPKYGCINVHFSLLPRWRGAAPVQHAILTGDAQAGISIMQMDKGLDTGPILQQAAIDILPEDNSDTLFARLLPIAQTLLLAVLNDLDKFVTQAQQQDDAQATYASRMNKQQAQIDWQQSAEQIDRQIRAFYAWPVAYTTFLNQTMRIFAAHVHPDSHNAPVGTLLAADSQGLDVATGQGVLRITEVQLPGKRRLAVKDFFNAHQDALKPGMLLA